MSHPSNLDEPSPMADPKLHRKFSDEIRSLLNRLAHKPLTLADILDETADHGVLLLIGLLVLPFLFPMPPGVSTILGSTCLLLCLQITFTSGHPKLPRRVAQFQFPSRFAQQLLSNLHRFTRFIEKRTRPRWMQVVEHGGIRRINGFCMVWLTLLLMSPVPFTNPMPAFGILLFAIAMIESDGLLMCIAYGTTGIVTSIFGVIGYLLWRSPDLLQRLFS